MEPWDWCGLRADGRKSSPASRSRAGRSSPSTWLRTRSASASSTWRSPTTDEPAYVGAAERRPRPLRDGGRQVLLAHGQEALGLGLGLALPLVRQVVVGR